MKILMVCLGNICRSPMAQGIMEEYVKQNQLNWIVDSAGTNGYHNGEHPDPRAIREIAKMGIDISHQISRKIKPEDLDHFDLILAMDQNNYQYLQMMCKHPEQQSKIQLLVDFDKTAAHKQVPDPYYDHRFHEALEIIKTGCQGVIQYFHKQ